MPTFTPESIYNAVAADNGKTPAAELAKQFGLKNQGQLMQTLSKHILANFSQNGGQMLPYPPLNVTIQEVRQTRSSSNNVNRYTPDAKLVINTNKLKELGKFDEVSTFEISVQDGNIVLTPLARFAPSAYQMVAENSDQPKKRGRRPKSELLETVPITGNASESTGAATSTSATVSSATPTEVAAAIPAAPVLEPEVEDEEFEDEEFELNANMV